MDQAYKTVKIREEFKEFAAPVVDQLPTVTRANIVERIEYPKEGGALSFYMGFKLPYRGVMSLDALRQADVVKKDLLKDVKFWGRSPERYFLAVLLVLPGFLFRKVAFNWVRGFTEMAHPLFRFHYIKPERMSQPVREIYRVGMILAGGVPEWCELVRIICLILETDRQYRFRLQDILSELNKEWMERNPAQELTRLVGILMKRDHARGWKEVGLVFKILLILRPEVKRIVKVIAREISLDEIELTKEDLYHFVVNPQYDVGGMKYRERTKIFDELQGEKLDWKPAEEEILSMYPQLDLG